jgi:hypothetical protein
VLTVDITLIRHRRNMYPLILDILQHIRFIPWIGLLLLLIHFGMNDSEHDIKRDLLVSDVGDGGVGRTKAARPPRTPPMIAPTGGLELSTAAPGGFGFVPLLNGPAGEMIVEDGLALEPATAGNGRGADVGVDTDAGAGDAGGLPLPLNIRYVLYWSRGLT